jgi:hypothetical protein
MQDKIVNSLKCGEVLLQIFGNKSKKSNCIHKEIKSRLNLGNACYHSVENTKLQLVCFEETSLFPLSLLAHYKEPVQ